MPVDLSAPRIAGDDAEYALVSRFEFAQKRFERQEARCSRPNISAKEFAEARLRRTSRPGLLPLTWF